MINLAFTLMMICPATKIENWTKVWNKQDQYTYDHAKTRCVELYPDAPCLKMFRKKDSTTYNAVCGSKE